LNSRRIFSNQQKRTGCNARSGREDIIDRAG
jgi:hypothetical protein